MLSAPESDLELLAGTPLYGEAVHARKVSRCPLPTSELGFGDLAICHGARTHWRCGGYRYTGILPIAQRTQLFPVAPAPYICALLVHLVQHLREAFDASAPAFASLLQAYPSYFQPDWFSFESYLWAAELWYSYGIQVRRW